MRCIQGCFLKQYVDSPTQAGNILDHVLGNEPGQVISVSVKQHFGAGNYSTSCQW